MIGWLAKHPWGVMCLMLMALLGSVVDHYRVEGQLERSQALAQQEHDLLLVQSEAIQEQSLAIAVQRQVGDIMRGLLNRAVTECPQ